MSTLLTDFCKEHLRKSKRYTIEKRLGEGSAGEVFLAYDTKEKRKVAIKIFKGRWNSEVAYDEIRMFKLFYQDCPVHSNPIYDRFCFEKGGKYYFAVVSKYIEGSNLLQMLEDDKLNEENSLFILLEVAKALKCLEVHGLRHGDVRDENIMITKDGDVKLVDYGNSFILSEHKDNDRQDLEDFIELFDQYGSLEWDGFIEFVEQLREGKVNIDDIIKYLQMRVFNKRLEKISQKVGEDLEKVYACVDYTARKTSNSFEGVLKVLSFY